MFSIEAAVFGRNDDYEPNWTAKLYAVFEYNHRLFADSRVDFRIAFVEWNPPKGRPLLAHPLVEKFPFVRVIVVDPEIHELLCRAPDLHVMTNFSYNVALRSSAADFCLITGGDDFFSTGLVRRIVEGGLRRNCLYRAERVNVREDLNFIDIAPQILEDPANVVSVDASDGPPYTNACGDFLLLDAGTMAGLRGLDESIRSARLHTDSRFAMNSMMAGTDCEMLGQIFHINHRKSFRNVPANYPGRLYKWDVGLPYVNPPDWGLASFEWESGGERILRVGVQEPSSKKGRVPDCLGAIDRERAESVAARLLEIHAGIQPEEPSSLHAARSDEIDLSKLYAPAHWDSVVTSIDGQIVLETGATQWGYAATVPLVEALPSDRWHWLVIAMAVPKGAIGIAFLDAESQLIGERYVLVSEAAEHSIPVPWAAQAVVFRNIAAGGEPSQAIIQRAKIVTQGPD